MAAKNVRALNSQVAQMKQKDVERLNAEYRRLLRGLNLQIADEAPAGNAAADPAQLADEPMRANPCTLL